MSNIIPSKANVSPNRVIHILKSGQSTKLNDDFLQLKFRRSSLANHHRKMFTNQLLQYNKFAQINICKIKSGFGNIATWYTWLAGGLTFAEFSPRKERRPWLAEDASRHPGRMHLSAHWQPSLPTGLLPTGLAHTHNAVAAFASSSAHRVILTCCSA